MGIQELRDLIYTAKLRRQARESGRRIPRQTPMGRSVAMPGDEAELLARLTTSHNWRMPYDGEPRGELFIHWFYRDRAEDRLSRCEIFHLNMLRYFNAMDRVECIHIRCAFSGKATSAMHEAVDILSGGKAKVDFQVVVPKNSWEHDTFKECVEYALETGKFVYYTHFKGVTRWTDSLFAPMRGGIGPGAATDLNLAYWSYLMYLALFTAPDNVKAIGPLLHLGMNRTYKNRDISWSRLCKGDQVFHYCGSFQGLDGTYLRECVVACGMPERAQRDRKLWVGDPYCVEMFLSMVSLKKDVYSLAVPYCATNGIYGAYTHHRIPGYEKGFKDFAYMADSPGDGGKIIVVGSKDDKFNFMSYNKEKFMREGDPDNFIYNEMCGHKYVLDHFDEFSRRPYIGLEHYGRAFEYTDAEIKEILSAHDIIVKEQHDLGKWTTLSVLAECSRHRLNYLEQATKWVEMFPELSQQACRHSHYGCNMFITTPARYKAMMEDEFRYIQRMMETPNLQRSIVSYFCETILTPYIIEKHNSKIFIGKVRMP